jgi:hypothetical protein
MMDTRFRFMLQATILELKGSAMEDLHHPLSELFSQLGLPSDTAAIEAFVASHRPLAPETRLAEAEFWSRQQAQFLCEAVRDDADWAPVVDQLDVLLRKSP